MIINILQPRSFSEIGLKDNQEDFLWPAPNTVTPSQRVFIMCDGVGGQDSGEVASQTAGTALGEYLVSNWPDDDIMTKDLFNDALAYAYEALDKADTGAEHKMGTTMTCIVIHRGGVLIAHIGDSRVYHIRPAYANATLEHSGVVYQTEDHSLVNDLLRIGEITQEQAADFPQKNVITRAMQPNQERRSRADIYNTTDVQEGDYFFLCCDGVLEKINNLTLGNILANKTLDNNAKIAAIKGICDSGTRDNYTCWLVPIGRVIPEDIDSTFITDDDDISLEASTVEACEVTDYEALKANGARVAAARASLHHAQAAQTARPAPRRAPRPVNPRNKESISTAAMIAIALAVIAVAGAVFAYFVYFRQPDPQIIDTPPFPEAPTPNFDDEDADSDEPRITPESEEPREPRRSVPAERSKEKAVPQPSAPSDITPEPVKKISGTPQKSETEENTSSINDSKKKTRKEQTEKTSEKPAPSSSTSSDESKWTKLK